MKQPFFIPLNEPDFMIHSFTKKQAATAGDLEKRFYESDPLFQLHSHDAMEILIFLNGDCTFFCEGRTYKLMQGDVVIVPPYAAHKAGVAHIENYERIVVNVHMGLLADFYESDPSLKEKMLAHKQRESDLLHLNVKQIQSVAALLQPMAKQRNESDAFSFSRQYALFQALRLIFQSAKTNPPVAAPQKQDSRLAEILHFIDQHATDSTLSLERVADRVHLNKYYFAHYFKKQMDVSFYRYVSLKRLAFAVSMMKKNDQSIEHIAIQCGFADYSSFYRLFKKEYGQSPKRWQVSTL